MADQGDKMEGCGPAEPVAGPVGDGGAVPAVAGAPAVPAGTEVPEATAAVLRRYKLTVAYDGTDFHGWQKQQPPGQAALRTVAGVLEAAVSQTVGQPVNLMGASRTDAGVHALGQVAQFDAATRIPVERLPLAVNARLPVDLEVVRAQVARPGFSCISHPVAKQYRYRFYNSMHRPLHVRTCVYHCWHPLDLAAMAEAGRRLEGQHDFAGFAAAGHNRESTVRTVFSCRLERHPIAAHHLAGPEQDFPYGLSEGAGEVHVVVQGDGFLYNMVRIIAGTLLEVGRGALPPEQVTQALETGDRRLAGPTLPPHGLCLEWIRYPDDHLAT